METYNVTKQPEIVEDLEYSEPSECGVSKQVTDVIVALVNQASHIAEENRLMEKHEMYDVNDAKTYIEKTDEKYGKAKESYDDLKGMKESRFWTIGRNQAKVEQTQKVLGDIIDAVNNNANATKALFNSQNKMEELSRKLYAIGLMGIASNRIVVREIKLRLEHASKEELSELARHELEAVIHELKKQQDIEIKIQDIKENQQELEHKIAEQAQHINDKQREVTNEIESINDTIKNKEQVFDEKINEVNEFVKQQAQRIDNNQREVLDEIESINNTVKTKEQVFDEKLNKVNDLVKQQANHIDNIKTELEEDTKSIRDEQRLIFKEQQDTICKLNRQMMYYKIIAILACAISIASTLYVFLM